MLRATVSTTHLLPVKEGRQGCDLVSPRRRELPSWLHPTHTSFVGSNHLQLLLQTRPGNDRHSCGTPGSGYMT